MGVKLVLCEGVSMNSVCVYKAGKIIDGFIFKVLNNHHIKDLESLKLYQN